MNRDAFLALLVKKMTGCLSEQETVHLGTAVSENYEYQQIGKVLEKMHFMNEVEIDKENRLAVIWKQIESNTTVLPEKKNVRSFLFLKVAAILLLAGGLALFFRYRNHPIKKDKMIVLNTTNEKRYTTLPDGTQVTLNYHSSLEYNNDFGHEKRKIILQGEAFFDVTKNPAVPLQVFAGPLMIEVKGTAFNVNAYRNNADVEVALLRGIVEVSRRGGHTDKVLLKPDQRLLAPNTTSGIVQFSIDAVDQKVIQQIHWKEDSLVFKKEKLQDIALRLEKKYNVTIEIVTAALKEKRFSGMFVNESLSEGLDALKLAYPFSYKIEDKKVTIR
ncbi:hypothetical protein A8C56_17680 [Niabella ginsenosidivorans]|uniref:FecR protein domain-containing protein n=1 Tax=Niabella ginsenosidivorans TaxID=1176587 RepID=A0A1A9I7C8_9BACT|nr:FecR domain-containing protein [Niabella ginsenosidivorans]ANH82562.1 hypothetical protein A8C56_17680 [Niabella ginsenosidivorans]